MRLIRIPENHVFASLDALALFTNVPKESAVKAVRKRWDQIINKTKILWENYEEGLRLCLDSTDFNFKGTTYYQKRGLPMGSPLSPTLEDIVMDDLEIEQLTKLGFEIPLYFRDVDDILLALPKCKIGNVLEGFNSNKFNIKFTLETE